MEEKRLSYARQYRPNSMASYIGNVRLKETAMSFLRADTLPQVVLLYGDSGCGKTTFGRIYEKEMRCENRDPEKGACGCCPSCMEMDEYIRTGDTSNLSGIVELDIGDNGSKRDIERVIEEMYIPTIDGEWRMFLFDEVHKASDAAQSALLKVFEEPPENVLMILCTTNPEELLDTIRNRCQYKLKVTKPKVTELAGLLADVCKKEDVEFDVKGLNFIANRAECTIREALQELEQVVTERGSARYEDVIYVFEEIADTLIVNYFKKLIGTPKYDKTGVVVRDEAGNPVYKRDISGYVNLIHEIKSKISLNDFVKTLVSFTKKGIYTINQVQIDGISDGELLMYRQLFGDFTVEQITYLIDRILTLTSGFGDIETKLLMLGYTGIKIGITESQGRSEMLSSDVDSGLSSILNEIANEKANADSERTKSRQEKEQREIENATMSGEATEEDILSMFGATTVTGI